MLNEKQQQKVKRGHEKINKRDWKTDTPEMKIVLKYPEPKMFAIDRQAIGIFRIASGLIYAALRNPPMPNLGTKLAENCA